MPQFSFGSLVAGLAWAAVGSAGPEGEADRLVDPIPVTVDGALLDHLGLSNPAIVDFDGDGRWDLLLGAGREGRLAIHRNSGSDGEPALGPVRWFDELEPTGTIPDG